jgi:hypothetical protein
MKEISLKKIFVLTIILLFLTINIPMVNSGIFNKKQINNNLINNQETVDITIYYPYQNKICIEKIELSVNEANKLKQDLEQTYNNSTSLKNIFEKQLYILKTKNIIPIDITLETILKNRYMYLNSESNNNISFNFTINLFTFGLVNLVSFFGFKNFSYSKSLNSFPNIPALRLDFYLKCKGKIRYAIWSLFAYNLVTDFNLSTFEFNTKLIPKNLTISSAKVARFFIFEGIIIEINSKLIGPLLFALGYSLFYIFT